MQIYDLECSSIRLLAEEVMFCYCSLSNRIRMISLCVSVLRAAVLPAVGVLADIDEVASRHLMNKKRPVFLIRTVDGQHLHTLLAHGLYNLTVHTGYLIIALYLAKHFSGKL